MLGSHFLSMFLENATLLLLHFLCYFSETWLSCFCNLFHLFFSPRVLKYFYFMSETKTLCLRYHSKSIFSGNFWALSMDGFFYFQKVWISLSLLCYSINFNSLTLICYFSSGTLVIWISDFLVYSYFPLLSVYQLSFLLLFHFYSLRCFSDFLNAVYVYIWI